MTVNNTYDEQTYVANGSATSFTWSSDYDDTFGTLVVTQIDDNDNLVKTYVEGEDYFIKNKKVFFYDAPTAGTRIHLNRNTYRGQEVTFIEGEDFPAKDYETSLDRLFMIEQEQDKVFDKEKTERIAADGVLQDNIDAEETARIAADGVLQDNIDAEETARKNKDNLLGMAITGVNNSLNAEIIRATGVEGTLSGLTTTAKSNLVAAINEVNATASTAVQPSGLAGYQTISNLVTSVSGSSTDSQYPSAKCVYDALADITGLAQPIFLSNVFFKNDTNANVYQISVELSDVTYEEGVSYVPFVWLLGDSLAQYIQTAYVEPYRLNSKYHIVVKAFGQDIPPQANSYANIILLPVKDDTTISHYYGAVNNGNALYQLKGNLVTSLSSSSTDTEYPSAKCVYDLIGDVETLLAAI